MEKTSTIIKPPSVFSFDLRELWQYRELLYFFTWRDIKVKYKQTLLGVAWALLQPLALTVLFVLVFSRTSIANSQSDLPYEVFVLSGLVIWNLFHTSVSHAADSMVSNSNIIRKIFFPRLIIPLSSILAALLDFSISLLILFIACLIYQPSVNWELLLFFPLSVLTCILTAFGLGSFLGALNVKYRDFRYALPFLLQFLFFGTQVIYSADMITDQKLKYVFALNPLNTSIELLRAGLGGGPVDTGFVIAGFIISVVIAVSGLVYFKKTESYFADII